MRSNIKIRIICLAIVILLIISSIFLFNNASTIVAEICVSEATAKVNDIINQSNDVVMKLNVFYSDYFSFITDNDNKITAIKANTDLINKMSLIWNTEIQKRLNKMRLLTVNIPSGIMTGSALLAQFGIEIDISAQVVSSCTIHYESKFLQAGINQTLHRLILHTDVNTDISVPLKAKNILISQHIVLAETIIPGVVPETILLGEDSKEYLDLLP